MLATASPETTGDTPTPEPAETRPVRLLVAGPPSRGRSGRGMADEIDAARRAGLRVPREENIQEFDPDPRKHLGWFWAYDDSRFETCDERRARYLGDANVEVDPITRLRQGDAKHLGDIRLLDMKGFARAVCRSYATVKDLKFEADAIRLILTDEDHLDMLVAAGQGDHETIKARLLAQANDDILTAHPFARVHGGQSGMWYVSDALYAGRRRGHLDEWYEMDVIKATGRPVGSRTKHRKAR